MRWKERSRCPLKIVQLQHHSLPCLYLPQASSENCRQQVYLMVIFRACKTWPKTRLEVWHLKGMMVNQSSELSTTLFWPRVKHAHRHFVKHFGDCSVGSGVEFTSTSNCWPSCLLQSSCHECIIFVISSRTLAEANVGTRHWRNQTWTTAVSLGNKTKLDTYLVSIILLSAVSFYRFCYLFQFSWFSYLIWD